MLEMYLPFFSHILYTLTFFTISCTSLRTTYKCLLEVGISISNTIFKFKTKKRSQRGNNSSREKEPPTTICTYKNQLKELKYVSK